MLPSISRPTALPKGRLSRAWIGALLAAVLLVATPLPARAGDGDLDPTFGDEGKVETDFGRDGDHANAVAVQPDGKIVAAGRAYKPSTGTDIALARYNLDGSLDSTFGIAGKLTSDFSSDYEEANALAIQGDDKLVIAGDSFEGGDARCVLARYEPDGLLDGTFGVGGKVIFNISDIDGGASECNALIMQNDNKLLVGGWAEGTQSHTFDFVLVRLNPEGSLDGSFGTDGKVTIDFSGHDDRVYALAVQSDGRIIAVGGSYNPADELSYIALVRYNPDGSVDSTFGMDGKVTTNLSGDVDASGTGSAVVIQADSRIIVGAGYGGPGYNHVSALVRYASDGTLDPTFGAGGIVSPASGRALVLQPDGKIISAGSWKLYRHTPNGAHDPTFDSSDTDHWLAEVDAIVMQSDGKIVTAGGHGNFALTRHENFVPTDDPLYLPLVGR